MQERTGKSDPLTLTAGKGFTQLTDLCLIALWQRHNEIMDRRLLACCLNLFLRCIKFCHPDISCDSILEQLGVLCHVAFHHSEVRCVYLFYVFPGDHDSPILHSPEPHQKLQQGRFSTAAPADDPDDPVLGKYQRKVIQYHFSTVRKLYIFQLRAGKCCQILSRDIFGLRSFVQDRKYAGTRGDRRLQGCSQTGQCGNRSKRTHERDERDQEAVQPYHPVRIKRSAKHEHGKVEDQDHCIGQCKVHSCKLIQLSLLFGKCLCSFSQSCDPFGSAAILYSLVKTSYAFQNISG